jgi:hypothetical protein
MQPDSHNNSPEDVRRGWRQGRSGRLRVLGTDHCRCNRTFQLILLNKTFQIRLDATRTNLLIVLDIRIQGSVWFFTILLPFGVSSRHSVLPQPRPSSVACFWHRLSLFFGSFCWILVWMTLSLLVEAPRILESPQRLGPRTTGWWRFRRASRVQFDSHI